MPDPLYAARPGDALSHPSMMDDILGGVLEVAANVAITALATAAVGVVVGVIVSVAMSKRGAPAESSKEFQYDLADNLIGRLHRSGQRDQRSLLHYDATAQIMDNQDTLQGADETFACDAAANLLDGAQSGAGRVMHNRSLTYQDKRYRYVGFSNREQEQTGQWLGETRFTWDGPRLLQQRDEPVSLYVYADSSHEPRHTNMPL